MNSLSTCLWNEHLRGGGGQRPRVEGRSGQREADLVARDLGEVQDVVYDGEQVSTRGLDQADVPIGIICF